MPIKNNTQSQHAIENQAKDLDRCLNSTFSSTSKTTNAPRKELIDYWIKTHGKPPPKGISRRLLEYAAAYSVQVKNLGGLRPETKRKLQRLAISRHHKKIQSEPSKQRPRLAPGTRLVREWHGRAYTVEVTDEAFIFESTHYTSLSQIALTITGARWSGPRFFGL
ncbi:MAG: DUF2924 domain-containing protein [Rhodospirillaceae bacterium]|nr:DUF2924 domain-containing protein [Rhodospirillaceae bacterium]